jgi:hypothetical protein
VSRSLRRFLFGWPASSAQSGISPHHLRHRLKSVRRRRAPACQGGKKSTEQAGPVSHNPNSTDFDDQTQQVETQAIRDVKNYTFYRGCHSALPRAERVEL